MESRKINLLKRKFYLYLKDINDRKQISEKEILRIKNLFNNSKYAFYYKNVYERNFNFIGFDLDNELKQKGRNYLIKTFLKKDCKHLRRTSRNDFVSRDFEEIIISKEFDFWFGGFVNITNGFFNHWFESYIVHDFKIFYKNCLYFHMGVDYEIRNGKIKNSYYQIIERI